MSIELHAPRGCDRCRQVAERLSTLVVSHRIVQEDDSTGQCDDAAHQLIDDGRTYAGHEQIDRRLDELAELRKRWARRGGDACYDFGDEDDPPG